MELDRVDIASVRDMECAGNQCKIKQGNILSVKQNACENNFDNNIDIRLNTNTDVTPIQTVKFTCQNGGILKVENGDLDNPAPVGMDVNKIGCPPSKAYLPLAGP